MLCGIFGWNLRSGFKEEVQNVKSWQTDEQTDKMWSEVIFNDNYLDDVYVVHFNFFQSLQKQLGKKMKQYGGIHVHQIKN